MGAKPPHPDSAADAASHEAALCFAADAVPGPAVSSVARLAGVLHLLHLLDLLPSRNLPLALAVDYSQ